MVAIVLTIALLVAVVAEGLHLWRCHRLRHLTFRDSRFPWGALATLAAARITGIALAAIGIVWLSAGTASLPNLNSAINPQETDRVIILLDASLSMRLQDAGPSGNQNRGERAADLIRDLLHAEERRLPRTTLMVFAHRATPLAIDTIDWNVLRHAINNRDLSESLFADEETHIATVLQQVCEHVAELPARSTVLMLVTDGDSEDRLDRMELPPSIRDVLVVGIGSDAGKIIDNSLSRQDAPTLQGIANAMGGQYINANIDPLPADALRRPPPSSAELAGEDPAVTTPPLGSRPAGALICLSAGTLLLVGAIALAPLRNPNHATPIHHETSAFLG